MPRGYTNRHKSRTARRRGETAILCRPFFCALQAKPTAFRFQKDKNNHTQNKGHQRQGHKRQNGKFWRPNHEEFRACLRNILNQHAVNRRRSETASRHRAENRLKRITHRQTGRSIKTRKIMWMNYATSRKRVTIKASLTKSARTRKTC